ncbi:fungal-specific transcription factor domain-containing protein [Xylaria sp. FL1777]|nr:fungal-specific transcription factor domain-containing protein [Xylaria sp. FL1777]
MLSAGKNKAVRGCWTCKDRRVRCDLGSPSCANCARMQIVCQGYGIRLSWPRESDTRRFKTSRVSESPADSRTYADIELVHTSFFDVEMHHYLVELRSNMVCDEAITLPDNLTLPSPTPLRPVDLNAEELELLRYFKSTAFSTLATISADLAGLRDMLVRMALMNHTIPSRAVLHALLAFSSLHRDGLQLQAAQHKTAAVGALAASAKNGVRSTTEAAQHVAANMLLCSFEIHMGTDSHGHWPWYLMGARDIIKAAGLEGQIYRNDMSDLVMWVYYHDVLARFSIFHWRRGSVPEVFAKELGVEGGWQRDLCTFVTKLQLNFGPLPAILRYLGDMVDGLCESSRLPTSMTLLQEKIHAIELGVRNVPEPCIPPNSTKEATMTVTLTELYRSAVLVYIARICENKFGESMDWTPLLDKSFAQIEQAHTCQHTFPIFILGCEANTDERRIIILDLLRRTEETYVRSLDFIRRALDSVWIQDDLNADQYRALDYTNKLNVVVSSSPTIPTFV